MFPAITKNEDSLSVDEAEYVNDILEVYDYLHEAATKNNYPQDIKDMTVFPGFDYNANIRLPLYAEYLVKDHRWTAVLPKDGRCPNSHGAYDGKYPDQITRFKEVGSEKKPETAYDYTIEEIKYTLHGDDA